MEKEARAMKMNRYLSARPCPKCGGKDMADRYCGPGTTFRRVSCRDHRFGHDEHIQRHCRRCHYEWSEAPLDAAADDTAKPDPATCPHERAVWKV